VEPRRPPPIRRPFLQGVFSFPLYRGVWLRCVVLSVLLLPVLFSVGPALMIATGLISKDADADVLYTGVVLLAVGCVGTLMWTAVMSITCLTILHETAAGNDQMEDWPELSWFVDWIGECFYIVNSLLLSVAPGGVIGWALNHDLPPSWLAAPVSLLVLLPIVLLSMLETGSPLNPISPAVWWSFWGAWWAWGLFYFETVAAAGALGGLAWAGVQFMGPFVLLAAPLLLVPALFIYFRLLGRLAWCCTQAARKAERADAEASPEREEDQP
jgi:hypothetical protein